MSVPRFTVTVEIGGDGPLVAMRDPQVTAAHRAIERSALKAGQLLKGIWIGLAHKLKIRRSGAYIAGIQDAAVVRSGPEGENNYVVEIDIVNTADHASIIEDGHEAFSLPQAIDWGNSKGSIKMGKNGPYLHIPFRHRAYQSASARTESGMTTASLKAMMPPDIYKQAQSLAYRTRNNVGPIRGPAPKRQMIAADTYRWGPGNERRLDRSHTRPAVIAGGPGLTGKHQATHIEHRSSRFVGRARGGQALVNPAWKTSKYHGMMKTGGPGHTQYMTIRTITPRSQGWNIPAMHGHGVARKVAAVVQYGKAAARIQSLLERAIYDIVGETPQ